MREKSSNLRSSLNSDVVLKRRLCFFFDFIIRSLVQTVFIWDVFFLDLFIRGEFAKNFEALFVFIQTVFRFYSNFFLRIFFFELFFPSILTFQDKKTMLFFWLSCFSVLCFQTKFIQDSKSTPKLHSHRACLWRFNCFFNIWLFETDEIFFIVFKRFSVSNKKYNFVENWIFFRLSHKQTYFSKKFDRFWKEAEFTIFLWNKKKILSIRDSGLIRYRFIWYFFFNPNSSSEHTFFRSIRAIRFTVSRISFSWRIKLRVSLQFTNNCHVQISLQFRSQCRVKSSKPKFRDWQKKSNQTNSDRARISSRKNVSKMRQKINQHSASRAKQFQNRTSRRLKNRS